MEHGARGSAGSLAAVAAAVAAPWAAWLATRRGLARLAAGAPREPGSTGLDSAVLELSSVALLLGACWIAAGIAVGVLETVTGSAPAVLRAATPAVARRVVAVVCGVTLGAASVGAAAHQAAQPAAQPATHPAVRSPDGLPGAPPGLLTGLALPERPAVPRAVPAAPARRVVVRPGDSLWRVAAGLLPEGAAAARVDRAWRLLYAANRGRVGPDPDLVQPGTSLLVPGPRRTGRAPEPAPAHHHSRREAP